MSTVVEIKDAIEKLSPRERSELEALIWPDWDRPENDAPPATRHKLTEVAQGKFAPGDRATIEKILGSLA